MAAGPEDRAFIRFEQAQPEVEIILVPQLPLNAGLGAQERGAHFRDQFLEGIAGRAERGGRDYPVALQS
ncbi:hypothetical protein D3C85_1802770 [compost metagenome]